MQSCRIAFSSTMHQGLPFELFKKSQNARLGRSYLHDRLEFFNSPCWKCQVVLYQVDDRLDTHAAIQVTVQVDSMEDRQWSFFTLDQGFTNSSVISSVCGILKRFFPFSRERKRKEMNPTRRGSQKVNPAEAQRYEGGRSQGYPQTILTRWSSPLPRCRSPPGLARHRK